MTTNSFLDDVEFDEARVKTKVIIETTFSKEIRILLKNGQFMKEHQTPFPILIHILCGQIELGTNGKKQLLYAGNIIALEGGTPHDLKALEDSIVRLTLSKQDSVSRVQNVVNNSLPNE